MRSHARSFLVLIIVIIPFVMVIYFGLATIICNEIVAARSGRPILPLELLFLRKIVPATVTYIGLSTWTLGRKTLRQASEGSAAKRDQRKYPTLRQRNHTHVDRPI